MKRCFVVCAALGALAGEAAAQSSVALFGILDVNGQWVDNDGVSQYALGQGGLAASRLGVRGTEDLGGGLSAGFWIEGALIPQTGTPAGQTWQRRSTVSVLGGWGEVRLGRDFTATYVNVSTFDPFNDSGVGAAGNLANQAPGFPPGGAWNTMLRASNMAAYFLPSGLAGGLYGRVQVAAGENVYGNKYVGGLIGYAKGPFNVALAYGETQVGNDTDGTDFNVGGSWNFGFMTLSGFYAQLKVEDNKQNNWFIGVTAPFGVWDVNASYGHLDRSGTLPSNIEGQEADQWAVGVEYNLSPRTSLYGTFSSITNKGGASFIVRSQSNIAGGGAAANADSQGVQVGVRHSF